MSKGENWASWGSMLETALQTAAVISSIFTASSTIHVNQFLMPTRKKKKKNQQSTQSIIMHQDRAGISLADWKVPEGNTSSIS